MACCCCSQRNGYESLENNVPTEPEHTVAATLARCQKEILTPYLRLHTLVGWRPIFPNSASSICLKTINLLHPVLITVLIFGGYVIEMTGSDVLQPPLAEKLSVRMKLFRLLEMYLVPDVLHSVAYLYAFYIFRVIHCENLPVLMERVFLQANPTHQGLVSQQKIITHLRMLISVSILWALAIETCQVLDLVVGHIPSTFFGISNLFGGICMNVLIMVCFMMLNLVYTCIILNYCVQCSLLLAYIRSILQKMQEHALELEQVMMELCNLHDHLKHLNGRPAWSVSLAIINFVTMAISDSHIYALKSPADKSSRDVVTFIAIFLWVIVLIIPLVLGALLTAMCKRVRSVGHDIRMRRFAFQNESTQDLDSFLLYTSTFHWEAKIFYMPTRHSCLGGIAVLMIVTLMLLLQTGLLLNGFRQGTGFTAADG